MDSLPIEAATSPTPLPPTSNLKQRLDSTLAQLPIANGQQANAEKNTREITASELVEPIQRINETMRPRGLEFELREESSRVITRVIDRESRDVIRQIPAEEVLKIAEQLEELQGRQGPQGQIISLQV
ncbi:MAG: flagellar protein FlaG protein [Halomonas sp. 54_146]|nr:MULTISPECIES: flagellar protein FlaG [unclassified Halomonas]KUJ89089.1 MAG: flagellar protein FlaG protein [Halomonas sp. 54_146]HAA45433.1 flagellar protein [Halomonas sp.]